MINWLDFCGVCVIMFPAVGILMAMIIEALKKIFGEENIKKKFGSLDNFNFLVTGIVSAIVFVVYILFFMVGKVTFAPLDIVKLVLIGLAFIFLCVCGAAVGYDKVLKTLKDIWEIIKNKFFPSK